MQRKIFVGSTENADEVGLESLYCLFGSVLLVIVWWNKLECHLILANCLFQVFRAFVVQYVLLWPDPCTV
jgi:hypothetical protein